ncbi:MAG TPA: hypothetical protein IAB01_04605 [Candidatus Avidesulfovibrio excrementigallinarum]|nr:hypothetical protein [Candidatus Avidesulfovibrio excrementigallinarum]
MNESWKYVLLFLGGVAVGAVGTVAISKNKDQLKPLAADLLSRGIDAKEAVMGKVERVKENMEDLLAEAQQASEQRKEARNSADA